MSALPEAVRKQVEEANRIVEEVYGEDGKIKDPEQLEEQQAAPAEPPKDEAPEEKAEPPKEKVEPKKQEPTVTV